MVASSIQFNGEMVEEKRCHEEVRKPRRYCDGICEVGNCIQVKEKCEEISDAGRALVAVLNAEYAPNFQV